MMIAEICLLVMAAAVCAAAVWVRKKKETDRHVASMSLFMSAAICVVISGALIAVDVIPPELTVRSAELEYGETISLDDLVTGAYDNRSSVTLSIAEVSPEDAQISENAEEILFETPGSYTVTVSAVDERGNEKTADATVTVLDLTPPVFTEVPDSYETGYGKGLRLGRSSLYVAAEDEITSVSLYISGVEAESGDATPIDCEIYDSDQKIHFRTIGTCLVTVAAEDEYGNISYETIPVFVYDDQEPEFAGLQVSFVIAETDSEPDYLDGVSAEDEIDGDLTDQISVDASGVNYGVPGDYTVTYSVADAAGNVTEQTADVTIKDTTPPVITLSKSSYSVTVGDDEPDYTNGVSAKDAVDGSVSVTIDDSDVDYDTPGTYEVTYEASDSSGNSAQKTASVTVKAKSSSGSLSSSSSAAGSTGTVYITKTGSKYHKGSCRYLSQSKIAISKEDAIARGYEACKVCKP